MRTLRRRQLPRQRPRPAQPSVQGLEAAERNRAAVARAVGAPVQARLNVGTPDDAQERAADRFAAQVMQSSAPAEPLQRKCTECQEHDEDEVKRKPSTAPPLPSEEEERRKRKPEAEPEQAQRKAEIGAGGGAVGATTAAAIQQARGGGHALPASERSFFHARTGHGFEQVRVHTDGVSATLSARLSARAFTVGRDVFFGAGEYRPGTHAGRWLLAHELAHVGQQGHATVHRWERGRAPAPADWQVIQDHEHLHRFEDVGRVLRGLLGSRACRNYFRAGCTHGGRNPLQHAFDRVQVYETPRDNNVFGESIPGDRVIAYNQRAYRIGRDFMAATLLHEMNHVCRPRARPGNASERAAENAVERCGLHVPWIAQIRPERGTVGSRVVIHGWGFSPSRGPGDEVRIGGVAARVLSWVFVAGDESVVRVEVVVPRGATAGPVVLFNDGVASNAMPFEVT